jgi:hypothetical protein
MFSTATMQVQDKLELPAFNYHLGVIPSWQDQAISAYTGTRALKTAAVQAELDARIEALINYKPAPESIYVDPETGVSTVSIDGTLFRLEGDCLSLVRPCAYCGTGEFTSEPIEDLADLGHALAIWQPMHEECASQNVSDWPDF